LGRPAWSSWCPPWCLAPGSIVRRPTTVTRTDARPGRNSSRQGAPSAEPARTTSGRQVHRRALSLRFNPAEAMGRCRRAVGDGSRPPCDPSDRTEVGHEGDDGGRTVECAPIRAARLPQGSSDAGTPPSLPRRVARLLHPPRGCAGRPGRCAAERPGAGGVPAAAEPGTRPPARLGQHLCRAGLWPHRRRAATRPAGRLPAPRRPAGVRGGRDHLAAL